MNQVTGDWRLIPHQSMEKRVQIATRKMKRMARTTKIKDNSDCGTLFFSDDSLEQGACLSTPDIVAMVLRGGLRPAVRYVVRTPESLTN